MLLQAGKKVQKIREITFHEFFALFCGYINFLLLSLLLLGPGDIKDLNTYADHWGVIKAALTAGMYPNVAARLENHLCVHQVRCFHKFLIYLQYYYYFDFTNLLKFCLFFIREQLPKFPKILWPKKLCMTGSFLMPKILWMRMRSLKVLLQLLRSLCLCLLDIIGCLGM